MPLTEEQEFESFDSVVMKAAKAIESLDAAMAELRTSSASRLANPEKWAPRHVKELATLVNKIDSERAFLERFKFSILVLTR